MLTPLAVEAMQSPDPAAAQPAAADLFQFAPASNAVALETAQVLAGLDRFVDARAVLRQLIDAPLSEADLLTLRDEAGADRLLLLASDVRLHPESRLLMQQVNAALEAESAAPDRIPPLIDHLASPGVARQHAAAELLQAGDAAVPALLAVDPASVSGAFADRLLTSGIDRFREGLLRELPTADPVTATRIVKYLAHSDAPEVALPLLRLRWSPDSDSSLQAAAGDAIRSLDPSLDGIDSPAAAARLLTDRALQQVAGVAKPFASQPASSAILDDVPVQSPDEPLHPAAALMRDAVALAPADPHVAAVAALVTAAGGTGADSVSTLPKDVLTQAFELALKTGHANAGRQLLRSTIQLANTERSESARSLIQRALESPDALIRIQAAAWAAARRPDAGGLSAVTGILDSAVTGSVRPEAVIAGFDPDQTLALQVLLEDSGYAVRTAPNAIDGFTAACSQMQCELFVINTETARWPLAATLANLRADSRTRRTLVVAVGPLYRRSRVTELDRVYGGIRFLAGPVTSGTNQSLTTQASTLPAGVQNAIQRRNALWAMTLRSLNIPPVNLSESDRQLARELASRVARP
jgi:hypothetical protein